MRELFTVDTQDYNPNGSVHRRPSARAIIERDGKVLVMHSRKFNYYKFPGGGIEQGETPEQALVREVREESGYFVRPETIEEYGSVLRRNRDNKDPEGIFEQQNYYYFCEIGDERVPVVQEDYEIEEAFEPVWVEFLTRLTRCNREAIRRGGGDAALIEREMRVFDMADEALRRRRFEREEREAIEALGEITQEDTTYGTAQNGAAPESTAQKGATPAGTTQEGETPAGTTPDDTAQEGAAPDDIAQEGAAPDGTAQNGAAPDGTTQAGAVADGGPHGRDVDYTGMIEYVRSVLEPVQTEGEGGIGVHKLEFGYSRFEHSKRVLGWAKRLYDRTEDKTGLRYEDLMIATIFHDVGRSESAKTGLMSHAAAGVPITREYLQAHGFSEERTEYICGLVGAHSDKWRMTDPDIDRNLLMLMEADYLDDMGALGLVMDTLIVRARKEKATFYDCYNHFCRYTLPMQYDSPMVTPEGKFFWDEKTEIVKRFVEHIRRDISV